MNPTSDPRTAYQQDGVQYLARIIELFGGYKKRSIEFLKPAPGLSLLDVGCGSGDDALAIASLLGPAGRVTGVDSDPKMLEAAEAKNRAAPHKAAFRQADAAALPFPDAAFDRVRADRVFQHLPRMEDALAEMIRVTKPEGWICVLDVDWTSLAIDTGHPDLTNTILGMSRTLVPHPSAGLALYGLFRRAGLRDVEAYAETVCVREWPIASMVWGLDLLAGKAAASGAITQDEARAWRQDLEERSRREDFFSSLTGYVVRGRKA